MTIDSTVCANVGALFVGLGALLGILRLRRRLDGLAAEAKKHREVTANLVDGVQGTRGRLTQVEKQLGRTMRQCGVPGLE